MESSIPALRMAALLGTQYQYAALNDVPPRVAAFSRIRTLLPSQRENSATGRPAPPPPQTTMSYSESKVAAWSSLLLNVTAPRLAAAALAPAVLRNSRRGSFASFSLRFMVLSSGMCLRSDFDCRARLRAVSCYCNLPLQTLHVDRWVGLPVALATVFCSLGTHSMLHDRTPVNRTPGRRDIRAQSLASPPSRGYYLPQAAASHAARCPLNTGD